MAHFFQPPFLWSAQHHTIHSNSEQPVRSIVLDVLQLGTSIKWYTVEDPTFHTKPSYILFLYRRPDEPKHKRTHNKCRLKCQVACYIFKRSRQRKIIIKKTVDDVILVRVRGSRESLNKLIGTSVLPYTCLHANEHVPMLTLPVNCRHIGNSTHILPHALISRVVNSEFLGNATAIAAAIAAAAKKKSIHRI